MIIGKSKDTVNVVKTEPKKSFMDQIRFLYGNGDFKGLLALSLDTMKYAEQTGNKKGVARAAFLAGIALLNGTDDAEAEKYFLKGKQAAIEGGSDKYHAENEFRLGILRYIKAEYEKVPPFYFNALRLFEKTKDTANIALLYDKLGDLYYRLNSDAKADSLYQKSYQYYTLKKDREGQARSATSLGNMLAEKGIRSKADSIYKVAEQINLEFKNENNLAVLLNNMAHNYEGMGRAAFKTSSKKADSLYHLGIAYFKNPLTSR